jgi:hypothetical protein
VYLYWQISIKKPMLTPAELIAFPKGIMGQLFWLAFSEQGKWEMLIKYNGESSILIG